MRKEWNFLLKGLAVLYCILASGMFIPANIQAETTTTTSYIMTLTAGDPSIPADGTAYTTITAVYQTVVTETTTTTDQNNNTITTTKTTTTPTPNVTLTFECNKGTFTKNSQPPTQSVKINTNANGTAEAYLYSDTVPGTAEVTCSDGHGTKQTVFVDFAELIPPPAFISLNATPYWIPSDGSASTAIVAIILDSTGVPVLAGTIVTFSTNTPGVIFTESRGKTYSTITTDDTGTITVHLISNGATSGSAVITCKSGDISQTIAISIVQLQYEVEPNNDMAHADPICMDNTYDNVYLGQLFSPYEEDWYSFTISTPSRISINFITTAIPVLAGTCTDSSTVGTYRVDIRDKDNNQMMSYQNVDCSLNNGIWETGVIASGTYYIVVYCPRLPDNSHYLSTPYYLAVSNGFYSPCGSKDQLVNSASLSLQNAAYHLYIPIMNALPYLWADLQYDPMQPASLMFRLVNCGVLTDLNSYQSCNLPTLSLVNNNFVLQIPVMLFDGISYRVELTYIPTMDGTFWFMLNGAWPN